MAPNMVLYATQNSTSLPDWCTHYIDFRSIPIQLITECDVISEEELCREWGRDAQEREVKGNIANLKGRFSKGTHPSGAADRYFCHGNVYGHLHVHK